MAVPHVSGTVALMLEENPALKPSETKKILESTSIDFGPTGKDNEYGSGRINAYEAVFYNGEKTTLPVANFTSNVTGGNSPLSVQFNDLSIDITRVHWDFDNNGVIDSIERNPVYVFTSPGIYTTNLTAVNMNGTNSKLAKINVNAVVPKKPIADFSASTTLGKVPLKVQFTDKSSNNPTSWRWSFGDGNSSTEQNPLHIYGKIGKHTVSFTATNLAGSNTKTVSSYITLKK